MKKVFFSLIIILAAAGYVFYRGWANIRVDSGEFAVISTKTSGVLNSIVENERFSWCWQMVIPKNAELIVFSRKPYTSRQIYSGALPSADIYSKLLKGNPDFTYDFDFSLSLKVSDETIVSLVKKGEVKSEEMFDEYINSICERIAKRISQYVIETSQDKVTAYYDEKKILEELKLNEEYPEVIVDELFIKSIKIPDLRLYQIAVDSYKKFQDLVDSKLEEAAKLHAEQFILEERSVKKLEKIGELLKNNQELNALLSSESAAEVLKSLNDLQ